MKTTKSLSISYRLLSDNGPETDFVPVDKLPIVVEHQADHAFTLTGIEVSIVSVSEQSAECVSRRDRVRVELTPGITPTIEAIP